MAARAFVTGGTGFVGANLVRALLEVGWQVRTLVRSKSRVDNLKGLDVEQVEGDLNDPDLDGKMRGCDTLFHAAAHYSLWQSERNLLYRTNVEGTRNVLAAARRSGVERTVYTSSVAAIGVGGKITDEAHQSPPEVLVGHYKRSKYHAEQEACAAARTGQHVVIVNPTAPIGPFDIKPTPTGDIVVRFLRRQMPAYIETSGLNFIDVRDVARGHLLALEKGRPGERYILGHRNLTIKQLLDELSRLTGLPSPALAVPAWLPLGVAWLEEQVLGPLGRMPSIPYDGVRMAAEPMFYDARKAVRELNLVQTPLCVALRDAVDWFVTNGYARV
jgi:dihydroflavonol-4-reductase